MIKSMTGFGRSETITEEYKISVEMKAVNHRYCDIGIKMPRQFNAFENVVRSTVKEFAARGKDRRSIFPMRIMPERKQR